LFFEDSKTLIDHGTTVAKGAGGTQDVGTHFKSVIWGWVHVRTAPTVAWVGCTGGDTINIAEAASMSAAVTLDWSAIGYTA